MKTKWKLITVLLSFAWFCSCGDSDEIDNGLMPVLENYNFEFIEYAMLPENSEPAITKYFTAEVPAKNFLPDWLNVKVVNVADGSTALVSYDYKSSNRSSELTQFEQDVIELTNEDYQAIWGFPYVKALNPEKSPQNELPLILKSNYPNAREGDFKIVSYQYSETEPVTTPDSEIIYLSEEFTNANSIIDNIGWHNLSANSQRRWGLRSYTGVVRAMATANGRNSNVEMDAWLISGEVDLSQAVNPRFTFNIAVGYFTHHCISILISTEYTGGENPSKVEWQDVTDEFNIPREGPEGYGEFKTAGEISLQKYAGKKIHVAFRFLGIEVPEFNRCTAYEVDDVLIYETGNLTAIANTKEVNDLYQYNGTNWVQSRESDIYILQPDDYNYLNTGTINIYSAHILIPALLKNIINHSQHGDRLIVIYNSNTGNCFADEFIFNGQGWVQSSPLPLEVLTDKYIYGGNEKAWYYESTDK